jgi:peptidoglycan-associated lipoprotein
MKVTMNVSWTLKTLAAGSLALLMAACATHKTPAPEAESAPAPAFTPAPAPAPAADTSAADAAAALKAKQMAEDQARADKDAADRAAADAARQAAAATLSVRTFYFDYDSSAIQDSDLTKLKAHAAFLAKNPKAKVRVEGNADERGTREYNMALGERRAKAVAAYLSSNGASAGQLTVVSYGKEKPASDGHDEAAWSKNRRVELDYTAGQP